MFWVSCNTGWIVDRYLRHWKSMWQPLPRFVPRRADSRSAERRLHPPRPPSVPPWDLEVVLRALSQPPFKPLTSVGLKELSLKTTLLLALASAKRIGDLHAFSMDSDCIRFGPGDCSVTLRPRMGYVPKSLSTPLQDCFSVCPIFRVNSLAWSRRSDFGVPCQGFEDLHRPFGQLSTIWPTIRVLRWLCERPGRFKTEAFPLDRRRYYGCLYEPRFGMSFAH